MNAFYTVLGIMFSIALGLLVTFNLQGITNKSVIEKIRKNIIVVRTNYIKYFALATTLYIIEKFLRDNKISIFSIASLREITLKFNFSIFTSIVMLFTIIYFIVNFIAMQKLNDDLYDEKNLNK